MKKTIKSLENQNEELRRTLERTRQDNRLLANCVTALQQASNGILAVLAQQHGEAIKENGEIIGFRLELDAGAVKNGIESWTVKSSKQDNTYIVGAMPK